jgi:ATP synthase protein I
LRLFVKAFILQKKILQVYSGGYVTTLVVKPLKQLANRIVFIQCIAALLLTLVFFIVRNKYAALAVLSGGLAYILPGYFYAAGLFSNVSPRAIMRIMCFFYLGEALKLMVSIGLFIVLFKIFTFPILPYFVGYLAAALTFCVASMYLMSKTMVNSQ